MMRIKGPASRRALFICFFSLAAPLSAQADPMRCGKWIVDEHVTVLELLEKCGPPAEKTSKTEDVLAVNALGAAVKVGTTTTERWLYQRSAGSLPRVVTIVDGRIKKLEVAER